MKVVGDYLKYYIFGYMLRLHENLTFSDGIPYPVKFCSQM